MKINGHYDPDFARGHGVNPTPLPRKGFFRRLFGWLGCALVLFFALAGMLAVIGGFVTAVIA